MGRRHVAGRAVRRASGVRALAVAAVAAVAVGATAFPVAGQELADFDYENLSFRGLGLEWGWLSPTRVDATSSVGVRMDMGYLGPGVRIVPGISWWSSTLERGEVSELEGRLADLVVRETGGPPPSVDLGVIDWSDLALSLDAHVVWAIPWDLLGFAGLGSAVHFLNGDGEAIDGTFVEDLLDSVTAGFNVHAGLEYPLAERFRVYGLGRYELLEDLRYFEVRLGGQVMLSSPGAGEERTR